MSTLDDFLTDQARRKLAMQRYLRESGPPVIRELPRPVETVTWPDVRTTAQTTESEASDAGNARLSHV